MGFYERLGRICDEMVAGKRVGSNSVICECCVGILCATTGVWECCAPRVKCFCNVCVPPVWGNVVCHREFYF